MSDLKKILLGGPCLQPASPVGEKCVLTLSNVQNHYGRRSAASRLYLPHTPDTDMPSCLYKLKLVSPVYVISLDPALSPSLPISCLVEILDLRLQEREEAPYSRLFGKC